MAFLFNLYLHSSDKSQRSQSDVEHYSRPQKLVAIKRDNSLTASRLLPRMLLAKENLRQTDTARHQTMEQTRRLADRVQQGSSNQRAPPIRRKVVLVRSRPKFSSGNTVQAGARDSKDASLGDSRDGNTRPSRSYVLVKRVGDRFYILDNQDIRVIKKVSTTRRDNSFNDARVQSRGSSTSRGRHIYKTSSRSNNEDHQRGSPSSQVDNRGRPATFSRRPEIMPRSTEKHSGRPDSRRRLLSPTSRLFAASETPRQSSISDTQTRGDRDFRSNRVPRLSDGRGRSVGDGDTGTLLSIPRQNSRQTG